MSPNYRRAFWTSRHHVWLALLTVGLGFASGHALALIGGLAAYAIGLVFIPDLDFFRRAIDARENAARDRVAAEQVAEFQQQQEKLLTSLSTARRGRYTQLVAVCRDIETATTEGQMPGELEVSTRRNKLDELAWTYLRMLSVEQSLAVYLETERKENVPAALRTLEAETQNLAADINAMKESSSHKATLAGKERLLTSRLERLASLQQRMARIEQAQSNDDLLKSEQERLVEQVKLIRADAIASKNADTLAARIDLSIQHLAETNRWISELAEFKDLTAQMPPPAARAAAPEAPMARGGQSVSAPNAQKT